MKGPVECVSPDQDMDKNVDFSEYMWMAEENLEDFDKQVEEELGEELMMNQALDAFEEQQEAALYARENLPLPGQRPTRNNAYNRGFQGGPGMNNVPHMNGYGNSQGMGGPMRFAPPRHQHYHPEGAIGAGPPPQHDQAAVAAIAATSTLNPNAPAFVFNPNAPVFVPSWASVASTSSSDAQIASSNTNGTSTNGSSSTQ
jgi:hypothetical protein